MEGELQKIRDGILALMDKKLIPLPSTDESKTFYHKMKRDYYRYLAECATDDAKSKTCEDVCFAYAEATKIAEKDLDVTHPIRLAMALNSSVFLHEVPQNPDEACGTKAVQDQLAMDTKFLQSLKTRCSETNEEFDRRVADRQAELKAVIDAIGIFNSDTSFDTFDKTDSTDFLQMSPLAGEQALRQSALSVLRDAMNKVVDHPVVQVPQIQVVEKTVEGPQLQIVEQIVETPETQTIQGIQTSESLHTAPFRQVHFTGVMKPDDPDSKIKLLAEEELHGVGDFVFDAHGNRVANEFGGRNCVTRERCGRTNLHSASLCTRRP